MRPTASRACELPSTRTAAGRLGKGLRSRAAALHAAVLRMNAAQAEVERLYARWAELRGPPGRVIASLGSDCRRRQAAT